VDAKDLGIPYDSDYFGLFAGCIEFKELLFLRVVISSCNIGADYHCNEDGKSLNPRGGTMLIIRGGYFDDFLTLYLI